MKHLFSLPFICAFLFSAQVQAISVSLNYTHAACSTATGSMAATVYGGTPPYSFLWSNGATTSSIQNLMPGLYSVVVTDALSQTASASWTIQAGPLTGVVSDQHGLSTCVGGQSGIVRIVEQGTNGTAPYTYSPASFSLDYQGNPCFYFSPAPPGTTVYIDATDANGCTGTIQQTVVGIVPSGGPWMVLQAVQGSCSNGNGGSATITNISDAGPYHVDVDVDVFDAQNNLVAGWQNQYNNVGNTVTFTGLPSGDLHMVREWDETAWNGVQAGFYCEGSVYDRIDFTIPDLGPNCGNVSGQVFLDDDQDCTMDAGDLGVPYSVLAVQPGPQYAITDADGAYSFDIVDGSYSLAQTDPTLVQLCPANTPVPFTIASNVAVIDLADSSTTPLNMQTDIDGGPFRPGFAAGYWMSVRNTSPQLTGPVTLICTLDPLFTYLCANPVPTTVVGNVLTWNLGAFTAFQSLSLHVNGSVPASAVIGTSMSTTAAVSNTLPDGDPSDDAETFTATITGSFDPNDKQVRTSTGWIDGIYLIGADEWLDYTIRFQNTGTDTAFTVVVTDTLDMDLDMETFEQGVASHPFSVSFLPGRVVEWRFANILLPDSNTNEALSHGLVSFRIRPVQPVLPGMEFRNNADIFFDFNSPVRTNDAVVTAEVSTQVQGQVQEQLRVWPNPVDAMLSFAMPNATGPYSIEVLGADGLVWKRLLTNEASMDMSALPAGVFALRVNGTTMRFVKR